MASTRYIQNNFTSGILSPLARGRVDINQYYNGMESCENFVLLPQGGIRKRGGTGYVGKCLGLTASPTDPSNVKLLSFSVESDTHYLLVFTEDNCRIFKKDGATVLADLTMPFQSDEIPEIRAVQAESVMLVFQENHAPVRIINGGDDVTWSTDTAPFGNIPQFDYDDATSPTPTSDVQVITFTGFNAGDTYQIDVEGVLSKNITYAGDTSVDEQNSTAFNLQKNLQDMPNFGETGVTVARTGAGQYTVTSADESAKAFELFSGFATEGTGSKTIAVTHTTTGVPRSEDVWSATRGYPRTACFYDGRLWLGGTRSKPQSLFASKAGSFYDYDTGEGDADEAIFVTISSRKLNRINDVYPGRDLQIFTSGSEFVVRSKPVTPESITVDPQTSHGTLNLEVKEVDGATFFIDRFGKKLLTYLYSFNEDAYATSTPSVLSPESIDTPVDMDILTGTTSNDANWVFLVNSDGTMSVLNTLREQDINGFTKFTPSGTNALYKNVVVVDDALYIVVNQDVDGINGNYVVKWDFDKQLDNSVLIAHDKSGTLAGIGHLSGETVSLYADNNYLGEFLVTGSGTILLPDDEQSYDNYEAGYLFTPTFKPLPPSTNVGSGNNFLRTKKVCRVNVQLYQTSLLAIDSENLPSRSFNDSVDSPFGSLQVFTGIYEDVYNLQGWDRDYMPTFSIPEAGRGTILSMDFEVESA